LAVRFTDTEGYFVSEASVCRLLKAHDLIASPAFIVMKAADEFQDKTTAPNQLWLTDFGRAWERLYRAVSWRAGADRDGENPARAFIDTFSGIRRTSGSVYGL
jgi:hypothetical protein